MNPKADHSKDDDEERYVSPTSDDTLAERYEKDRARNAKLSNKERLEQLRNGFSPLDDSTGYDEP